MVSVALFSFNLNILCYISGDKKLQAVLSNVTKTSSTLRKAVVQPRRTESNKANREDRSQSRSPARARRSSRSPQRKKSHSGWSHPGSSRKTAKNRDYRSGGRGNRAKTREKSKSASPDKSRKKK